MFLQSCVIMYLTLVAQSWAYPSGAHGNTSNLIDAISSHCASGNFRPNHGNILPHATPAPYVITVTSPSESTYKSGQVLTVTIESNKTPHWPNFKGFFLQGDSTEETFTGDITCPGSGKAIGFCGRSGVTHVNAQVKNKLVCTWKPPDF